MLRISTGISVAYINGFTLKVSCNFLVKTIEFIRVEFDVDVAPPYGVFRLGVTDHKFVFGGTASEFAGIDCKRTGVGQHAFTSDERFFDQFGRSQVPIGVSNVTKAKISNRGILGFQSEFVHDQVIW